MENNKNKINLIRGAMLPIILITMNYSEYTEQVRIATITNNINVTITIDEIKFGFKAYTRLMLQGARQIADKEEIDIRTYSIIYAAINDASFNESIELILDKKHKKYTRIRG